jgi:carbamoyl-phosphate synthase large subunit
MITNGQINLVFITSTTGDPLDAKDGRALRRTALAYRVPIVTTIQAGSANQRAIKGMLNSPIKMVALQDYFKVPEVAKA